MPSPATDSVAFAFIISNPGFGYIVAYCRTQPSGMWAKFLLSVIYHQKQTIAYQCKYVSG